MADILITLSLAGTVSGMGTMLYRTSPYNRTRLNKIAYKRLVG